MLLTFNKYKDSSVPMWWENQSPSVHVGKFQTKLMIQILFQTQLSQTSNSGFALGKTTKLQYQTHYQNDSSSMSIRTDSLSTTIRVQIHCNMLP
jgi:hypothetical protein